LDILFYFLKETCSTRRTKSTNKKNILIPLLFVVRGIVWWLFTPINCHTTHLTLFYRNHSSFSHIFFLRSILPRPHDTSISHLILNCGLFVILSSALPLLVKVLGRPKSVEAVLWIRLDLIRIRIQHFFQLQIRIQFQILGFDDQKLEREKIYSWKFFYFLF
jgi:hypothetical protein